MLSALLEALTDEIDQATPEQALRIHQALSTLATAALMRAVEPSTRSASRHSSAAVLAMLPRPDGAGSKPPRKRRGKRSASTRAG